MCICNITIADIHTLNPFTLGNGPQCSTVALVNVDNIVVLEKHSNQFGTNLLSLDPFSFHSLCHGDEYVHCINATFGNIAISMQYQHIESHLIYHEYTYLLIHYRETE